MKKIIIILGPIIVLIITFITDYIFYEYQKYQNNNSPVIPFGVEIPVYLIISIILIYFSWIVLYRNPYRFFTAAIFIVIGTVVLFSMSPTGYFFLTANIHFLHKVHSWYTSSISSIYGFTRNSAAIILAIGLIRLLPDKVIMGLDKGN